MWAETQQFDNFSHRKTLESCRWFWEQLKYTFTCMSAGGEHGWGGNRRIRWRLPQQVLHVLFVRVEPIRDLYTYGAAEVPDRCSLPTQRRRGILWRTKTVRNSSDSLFQLFGKRRSNLEEERCMSSEYKSRRSLLLWWRWHWLSDSFKWDFRNLLRILEAWDEVVFFLPVYEQSSSEPPCMGSCHSSSWRQSITGSHWQNTPQCS